MRTRDWVDVPVGLDAARWVTREGLRTVLVVAHSIVALQRLLDIVQLFETDWKIQTVFTQGPGAFSSGVDRAMDDLGCVVIPWEQAVNVSFDLALASGGYTSLHQIHAPVVVFAHGAGHNKFVPVKRTDIPTVKAVYGLNPQQLIRDGNVVPSVIALPHDDELQALKEHCPEALSNGTVVGDPCLDRILVSRSHRVAYRDALGLSERDRLLVISSTWGPHSLFGAEAEIFGRAMKEAQEHGFVVAALLHPGIWTGHGQRQVRQWFRPWIDSGLVLVGPDEEWRAALASADWVISDHGSTCVYGIAAGSPVLHIDVPPDLIVPGSAMELVHGTTPSLRHDSPIYSQLLKTARTFDESTRKRIMQRLTSAPGGSATLIRRVIYSRLGLKEPPAPATFEAVSPIVRALRSNPARHRP